MAEEVVVPRDIADMFSAIAKAVADQQQPTGIPITPLGRFLGAIDALSATQEPGEEPLPMRRIQENS